MSGTIQALQISEEKKNYITNKISPLLEDLVTELITTQPDDITKFCHNWFAAKVGAGGDDVENLKKKNEDLRKSLLVFAEAADVSNTGTADKAQNEEEEESSDDESMTEEQIAEMEAQFERNLDKEKKVGARTSVSAEAYGNWNQKNTNFQAPVHAKSDEQKDNLKKLLATCWFFTALGAKEMDTVIGALQEVNLAAGTQPITKGDYGDYMFVIETGTLECWKENEDGSKLVLKTVETGDIFGELALLYNCTRAAHVSASTDCKVWKLDRDTFANIVVDANQKHRENNMKAIADINLLKVLDDYQKSQLCDALRTMEFKAGDVIINQDEHGDDCYFVKEGTLVALKDGNEVKTYSPSSEDRHFGELALLNNTARAATVKCQTDAVVMALDRKAFGRLLGDLMDVLRQTSY